ncbi:Dynein light chain 1, axonemal [Apostasia shenzhenica]|uniref:Dynein light chain 1, axonemal n=1 Tax=Apostasia shenzhenica TaxID=1088818 RepID=A0A2I0AKK3_9ASPA|nr:Dynein light chain 1, axonemal [Apostasia shenzhenica]
MAIVTGDRYLDCLERFVEQNAETLLEGTTTLKLNPVGLHYVQSRLEALHELEGLLAGAPVDYLRAYVSDLGDHRALEQLRRILGLLTSLKVVSVLPPPTRDPTPLCLQAFGRLKVLELRGCDLSTSCPRGLLELRHTLEKLICHNSTDALRHVFASRIADIKDSPVWRRLTLVSCAQNKLVVMDESLQLLPIVETLDLSRNQFAKLDNLCKSSKLRHLDLGFNHLRSVASFSEVSCPVVKLVLRNNALTTLRGIENLKTVEGVDLSYNLISSFSEMEILANLPRLRNLWLEGNPICCSRWYRAYVFSFFSHPEALILDDKSISTKEYWERLIIFTSRQKQPPAYGFYFPAKDHIEDESSPPGKKRRYSRLVNIQDDEQRRYHNMELIEQDSWSCDSDILKKDENVIPDDEPIVVDLMNKVEHMKKERSVLWLRDFKDWMNHNSEDIVGSNPCTWSNIDVASDNNCSQRENDANYLGESSLPVDSIVRVRKEWGISIVYEIDASLTGNSSCGNGFLDGINKAVMEPSVTNAVQYIDNGSKPDEVNSELDDNKDDCMNPHSLSSFMVNGEPDASSSGFIERERPELTSSALLTSIDEIIGSYSSSTYTGSPPHYKEDILHRRLYLQEEFLQQSTESRHVESSDSDTSSSDDECAFSVMSSENDRCCSQESWKQSENNSLIYVDNHNCKRHELYCTEGTVSIGEHHDKLISASSEDASSVSNNQNEVVSCYSGLLLTQDTGDVKKMNCRDKFKTSIVSLFENLLACNKEKEGETFNGILESEQADMKGVHRQPSDCDSYGNARVLPPKHEAKSDSDLIKNIKAFFNQNIANFASSEKCERIVFCRCLYSNGLNFHESETALLRSCQKKLYLLLLDETKDRLDTVSSVLGCHSLDEIREVVTGLGLQALRVKFEGGVTYLLITKTVDTSKNLFGLLQICDSCPSTIECSIRSWEQVQVDLLEKSICKSLKTGIYFYSMVFFSQYKYEENSWLSRSLFLIEEYIVVCIENLLQFGSPTDDIGSPSYYSFESCCHIQNIREVVIESEERRCLTLMLETDPSTLVFNGDRNQVKNLQQMSQSSCTWKLKLFSEDSLLRFVSLLKAIYSGISANCLNVKHAF